MWTKLLVISALCVVVAWTASTRSARPSTCKAGESYQKDCNTCVCGDSARNDKCSKRDCARLSAAASSTARTPTGIRPGACPTIVTPAPGSNSCEKRNPTSATGSSCTKDKDCSGSKKCCRDGCDRFYCRNAIYNYVNGTKQN